MSTAAVPYEQFTPAHLWEIRDLAQTITYGGAPGFWSTGHRASFCAGRPDRVTAAIAMLELWGYGVERMRHDEAQSFRVVSASLEPMTAEEWQAVARVVAAAGGPLMCPRDGRDIRGMDYVTAMTVSRALSAAGWRNEVLEGQYEDGSGPLRILSPRPPVVVTRHATLVEYLRETGVVGADVQVIAHVESPEQIRDRRVIGVLPLHLACAAMSVTEVPMQLTPADREAMQRGDLPLQRVREVAGKPQTYRVSRVAP